MKKKLYVILSISVLLFTVYFILNKWNIDIYTESLRLYPNDKIDLKITIGDNVVFNDTLQRNLGGYPVHIVHPMRIGYHRISVSSNLVNIHENKKVFLFFNEYILIYYLLDKNNQPAVRIDKGRGRFGFE